MIPSKAYQGGIKGFSDSFFILHPHTESKKIAKLLEKIRADGEKLKRNGMVYKRELYLQQPKPDRSLVCINELVENLFSGGKFIAKSSKKQFQYSICDIPRYPLVDLVQLTLPPERTSLGPVVDIRLFDRVYYNKIDVEPDNLMLYVLFKSKNNTKNAVCVPLTICDFRIPKSMHGKYGHMFSAEFMGLGVTYRYFNAFDFADSVEKGLKVAIWEHEWNYRGGKFA